jgi:PAS domain-containing protein
VSVPEDLLESIYRATLEPAAWGDVMQLLARRFPSSAQAFYYLHRNPHRLQPVLFNGIERQWLTSFNALYFAPDNPWIRLTHQLHRPGVVRTNERLDRFLRQRGALYRSAYYNDWMRPQGFRLTLGNTLLAEADLVANITLFRPPGMRTFTAAEVRDFEMLSSHMTRALRLAVRLEHPQNLPAAAAAFAACSQPIAILDRRRRLRYANAAMESLLRRRDGLVVRGGELVASCDAGQPALQEYLDRAIARWRDHAGGDPAPLVLRDGCGRVVSLRAVPLASTCSPASSGMPGCVLTVGSGAPPVPMAVQELRAAFGFTLAEARLARLVGERYALRDAARQLNITYESARGYLKVVFAKAQLVGSCCIARVLLGGVDKLIDA